MPLPSFEAFPSRFRLRGSSKIEMFDDRRSGSRLCVSRTCAALRAFVAGFCPGLGRARLRPSQPCQIGRRHGWMFFCRSNSATRAARVVAFLAMLFYEEGRGRFGCFLSALTCRSFRFLVLLPRMFIFPRRAHASLSRGLFSRVSGGGRLVFLLIF